MPKTLTHPAQVKGGTYFWKGKAYHIKDFYVLDGMVVFRTDSRDIKINKSTMKEDMKGFAPVNGTTLKDPFANILGNKKDPGPVTLSDPVCDHYYWTRDYKKFKFNRKNRPVNKVHVRNLIDSIKVNDLLFAQPILVNEHYEVIDGQHRLKAATYLDKKIYYIIKPGLTIEDAIALNVNTKNWGYKDYLHYWMEQGKENYIYFSDFLDKYKISYSISTGLLMLGQATSGNKVTRAFNDGNLEINHKEYAERLGDLIADLSEVGNFTSDRSFVMALDMAISSGEFDQEIFKKKVRICPDKFTKCSDADSYLRMLEDVINYHNRGKRVRLY